MNTDRNTVARSHERRRPRLSATHCRKGRGASVVADRQLSAPLRDMEDSVRPRTALVVARECR
jgi:hypothetical protein